MLSAFRSHVRHNVVGYFALFFALTGVAYAAGPLKPGDPAGGDLAGTYPNPSIAGDAVTSGKVSDDSLTGADIDESSLAKVGDADTLDGRDSRDFARFSGVVQSDGTVFSGSGFTASRLSEGEYEVAFPAGTLSNANCPPAVVAIPFGPPSASRCSAAACARAPAQGESRSRSSTRAGSPTTPRSRSSRCSYALGSRRSRRCAREALDMCVFDHGDLLLTDRAPSIGLEELLADIDCGAR